MADQEPFTFVSDPSLPPSSHRVYPDYETLTSAKFPSPDVQYQRVLREKYPGLNLTTVPVANCSLLQFAAMGHATAELDIENEAVLRWRGYSAPLHRGGQGGLVDATNFAKYHFRWSDEHYIVYVIRINLVILQYILKEPATENGEDEFSHCAATDILIKTASQALAGDETKFIYVFDGYWTRSKTLYDQVQKASWDKVILDPKMKKALVSVSTTFFDSKAVYDKYGVPWKRGVIFHGPPGNGKTVSIKALMHTLYERKDAVPTLYVKSAPQTFHLRQVFTMARIMSPCVLVLEDIDTIVSNNTRAYFFNEVDGLANNDGIFMIASTNYLERLDPGLVKRPSRFDRKYLFPLPNETERTLYAAFWRKKVIKTNSDIAFPEELCPAIARISYDFSFAYLQEAFVATLLALAREEAEYALQVVQLDEQDEANSSLLLGQPPNNDNGDGEDKDLLKYKLYCIIKEQIAVLREDMQKSGGFPGESGLSYVEPQVLPSWTGTRAHGQNGTGEELCSSCNRIRELSLEKPGTLGSLSATKCRAGFEHDSTFDGQSQGLEGFAQAARLFGSCQAWEDL